MTVTQAAKRYLAEQLEQHASSDICFRLRANDQAKLSTTVGDPSPDDVLVRHGKRVVLAIERDLADRLEGNTIDLEPTDDGRNALIVL